MNHIIRHFCRTLPQTRQAKYIDRLVKHRYYTDWPFLNDDHVAVANMCRNFSQTELVPIAATLDKEHRFPKKQVDGLAHLGLMGVAVSSEFGGSG